MTNNRKFVKNSAPTFSFSPRFPHLCLHAQIMFITLLPLISSRVFLRTVEQISAFAVCSLALFWRRRTPIRKVPRRENKIFSAFLGRRTMNETMSVSANVTTHVAKVSVYVLFVVFDVFCLHLSQFAFRIHFLSPFLNIFTESMTLGDSKQEGIHYIEMNCICSQWRRRLSSSSTSTSSSHR